MAGALATAPQLVYRFGSITDMISYHLPNQFFLNDRLYAGEFPLWNPLLLCGTPFAANPQALAVYPPNLLLHWVFPRDTAPIDTLYRHATLMAIHVFVAGLGLFALLRSHGLSTILCVTGVVLMAVSAPFLHLLLNFPIVLFPLCYGPLLLLSVRKVLQSSERRIQLRWSAVGALLIGLSFLAGYTLSTVLLAVVLGVYAVGHALLLSPAVATRDRPIPTSSRRVVPALVTMAIIFTLGGAVSAVLLIPGGEFAGLSDRAGSVDSVMTAGRPSINPAATEHLSPAKITRSLFVYPADQQTLFLRSFGILPLSLCVLAFMGSRVRPAFLFGLLAYVVLDLTLWRPFPVATVIEQFVPFKFDSPYRFWGFQGAVIAVLAAFGLDTVRHERLPMPRKVLASVLFVVFGTYGVLSLGYFATPSVKPQLVNYVVPIVGSAGALWMLWQPLGPNRFHAAMFAVLIALTVAEPLTWQPRFIEWVLPNKEPRMDPFHQTRDDEPAGMNGATFWADNSRGFNLFNRTMYQLAPNAAGYEPLHILRTFRTIRGDSADTQYRRIVSLDDLRSNRRVLQVLKRQLWLHRQVVEGPLPPKEMLFPAAITVFAEDVSNIPIPVVPGDSVIGVGVSENVELVPLTIWRALPGPGASEENPQKAGPLISERVDLNNRHAIAAFRFRHNGESRVHTTLNRMGQPGLVGLETVHLSGEGYTMKKFPVPDATALHFFQSFEAGESASVPELEEGSVRVDLADENGLIEIVERTANRLRIELANVPGPRVLTNVDSYYPGWVARIDGERAEIHLVNDAFKGVVIPPGNHTVEFVFRPMSFRIGLAISLATSLACLAIIAFSFIPRKQQVAPDNT